MEPLPETVQAAEELGPFAGDELLESIVAMGARVQVIVPDCVGLSLASSEHGVTFTLVATTHEIATLDAIQYLADDGPCLEAVRAERVLGYDRDDLLAERTWQDFAAATADVGVASTLTLPILAAGRVTGSINLYAASDAAFTGHHEAIADVFGAWAPGAIANADLMFRTRQEAVQAPERLRQQGTVDRATGLVAESEGISLAAAQRRLCEAAERAGISEAQLAEAVLKLRRQD
jgi:GAF domain-containing protein